VSEREISVEIPEKPDHITQLTIWENKSRKCGLGIDSLYILNDPFFWQALGKALGWKLKVCVVWDWDMSHQYPVTLMPSWEYHALRYHEINLTGGDTEKFWRDIINQ
jgi:hypothetical protein